MKSKFLMGILALMMILLALPGVVSAADVSVSGSVVDEDLSVTALAINPGSSNGHDVISANEPNTLRVWIKNNGGLDAGAFDVTMIIGAFTQTVNVAGRAAGENTSVDFTYAPTAIGAISIVTTADSGAVIAESNEANNALTTPSNVYYNGYKGKRYTAGNDFTTVNTYTGRDGVVYSTGNAPYLGYSPAWTSYSASFTAAPTGANLNIPSDATILSARLYQPTNWDTTTGASALWTATFNSGAVTPTATYTDRKGYGQYNYPSELVMYDVTSTFNKAGTNTWSLTHGTGLAVALYPTYMVVVFQDPATQTEKTIIINDECDLLYSKASYNTNDVEATAYAPFTGVDVTIMSSAKAIAFVAAVNEDGDSKFYFNNVVYDDFYIDSTASTAQKVSIKEFTLTNIVAGANEAKLQSSAVTADGDNMQAQNVILVIEKTEGAVNAAFTPDMQVSGDKPYTVNFDSSTSTGNIVSYAWTFGDGGISTAANPSHEYTARGTYDVSLTVTGISSSDTETKNALVVVKEPAPTITDFTVVPTSGTEPLNVAFHAITTGTVTTYKWEYKANSGSTWNVFGGNSADATRTFANGDWDVRLTVDGLDYTGIQRTEDHAVIVGEQIITVGVSPSSINFGTMAAGVPEEGATTVSVTVDGGTGWNVIASATNGGKMMSDATPLTDLFQVSNDNKANYYTMDDNLEFLTGSAGIGGSQVADVKQTIQSSDAPGAYSITLTFTGNFV